MKKFFDTRREMVSSGPAIGAGAGGSAASGAFIGRVFSIGRYQVTVEETVAEGKRLYAFIWTHIDLNVWTGAAFKVHVYINK